MGTLVSSVAIAFVGVRRSRKAEIEGWEEGAEEDGNRERVPWRIGRL